MLSWSDLFAFIAEAEDGADRAVVPAGTVDPQARLVVLQTAPADPARSLVVLVHPGDAVETPDDVVDLPARKANAILRASYRAQVAMARELRSLTDADLVVLHRASSGFSFQSTRNVSPTYVRAIERIHATGTVLYGDHLDATAAWLVAHMHAALRPRVLVTGAWSEAEHGCVAALADHLQDAGARVAISGHAPADRTGGRTTWTPRSPARIARAS